MDTKLAASTVGYRDAEDDHESVVSAHQVSNEKLEAYRAKLTGKQLQWWRLANAFDLILIVLFPLYFSAFVGSFVVDNNQQHVVFFLACCALAWIAWLYFQSKRRQAIRRKVDAQMAGLESSLRIQGRLSTYYLVRDIENAAREFWVFAIASKVWIVERRDEKAKSLSFQLSDSEAASLAKENLEVVLFALPDEPWCLSSGESISRIGPFQVQTPSLLQSNGRLAAFWKNAKVYDDECAQNRICLLDRFSFEDQLLR